MFPMRIKKLPLANFDIKSPNIKAMKFKNHEQLQNILSAMINKYYLNIIQKLNFLKKYFVIKSMHCNLSS